MVPGHVEFNDFLGVLTVSSLISLLCLLLATPSLGHCHFLQFPGAHTDSDGCLGQYDLFMTVLSGEKIFSRDSNAQLPLASKLLKSWTTKLFLKKFMLGEGKG